MVRKELKERTGLIVVSGLNVPVEEGPLAEVKKHLEANFGFHQVATFQTGGGKTTKQQVEEIREILEKMRSKGIKRVVGLGHSGGAYLLRQVLEKEHSPIFINVSAGHEAEDVHESMKRTLRLLQAEPEHILTGYDSGKENPKGPVLHLIAEGDEIGSAKKVRQYAENAPKNEKVVVVPEKKAGEFKRHLWATPKLKERLKWEITTFLEDHIR